VAKSVAEDVTLREAILSGIDHANHAVSAWGIGAATTLCLVEIQGHTARAYQVGDSMMLVTGQRGRQKSHTTAHSPTGYGVVSGLIDEDDALHHEERHLVSNLVGDPGMHVEIGPPVSLAKRDTGVLASDGLWDNLYRDEIVARVRKGPLLVAAESLQADCQHRMREPIPDHPNHPDDLTFLLFRRA